MAGLLRIALSILLVAGIGKAQIPEPCANAQNFLRRECCPTPNNVGDDPHMDPGPCGMNLTPRRGQCVQIPGPNDAMNVSDPRQNWPRFYFTRVCICTSNYGGYDCGECAFGYRGSTCNQEYTRQRRSTSELNDEEWDTYITQLRMAKSSNNSRYRVITSPPDHDSLSTLQTVPIGVYNLFVWFHHYVAKDNEDGGIDYAHEATGFPTWHRLFLLWFEREMQIFLKDEDFTVHYWDWRDPNQRRSLFRYNRLGEHNITTAEVTGHLVDNDGWQTVCWYNGSGMESPPEHRICDPSVDTGALQRCPDKTICAANYEGWPTDEDVQTAVRKLKYDSPKYNKVSPNGFRTFMEGFQVVERCDTSSVRGQDLCTRETNDDGSVKWLQRQLHNTVHIMLGIGHFTNNFTSKEKGVMGNVAASANDPIFINHHAMVDCILEKWLQNNIDDEDYPTSDDIRQGHRRDDYIVPFIPLYTHNMMYKRADSLGYTCNLPDLPTTPMTTTTPTRATAPPTRATAPPTRATAPPTRATAPPTRATAPPTRATAPPLQATTEPDSANATTALLYVLVLAIVGGASFILFF